MNETTLTLPTGDAPATSPKDRRQPGDGLTLEQRQAVELMVREGLNAVEVGKVLDHPNQTIYYWLGKPDVQEYHDHLLNLAVTEAQKGVKSVFSRAAVEVAEDVRLKAIGKGRKGKPAHPYQLGYAQMVLDRVAGKPGQSQEVGVKVETEAGPVYVVFKSKGA